jgi:uncharacterized coiled-coil protein SlyX
MALFEIHHHHDCPASIEILQRLRQLEAHLSKQDDAIKAFSDKVTAQLTTISGNLDNIAADESNLAKQIADLKANAGELTPENQAALDAIAQQAADMATRTQGIADSIPDTISPTSTPNPASA